MNVPLIVVIVFTVVALIQISVSMQFLNCVEEENKAEYDRIRGNNQKGWLLINPLIVGAAYSDPELHELWGLSDSTKKLGLRLKRITRITYVAAIGAGVALIYHSF